MYCNCNKNFSCLFFFVHLDTQAGKGSKIDLLSETSHSVTLQTLDHKSRSCSPTCGNHNGHDSTIMHSHIFSTMQDQYQTNPGEIKINIELCYNIVCDSTSGSSLLNHVLLNVNL